MKTLSLLAPLTLWSGSAMAINMLSVGATSGNMASGTAFSVGDLSGSWEHVSEGDFNSMSLMTLMSYDVIVVQWNSGELDLDWDTKMSTYVEAGGGYWHEDPNNTSDLGSLASSSGSGCSPGVLVDTVPGLTDGITDSFVNCHIVFDSWDSSVLSPLLNDGGNITMLYGEYGGGRVILSGPDHDYHASKGGGSAAGNQYNFVLNIVNWISDGCEAVTWYADGDGDGYGNAASSTMACDAPSGYVADASDCNDGDASINPAAAESCDGVDNNCDGSVDPDSSVDASTWYSDYDGDGYGDPDPSYATASCALPSGYVADSSDCNDGDASINPGASEVCDGIDNNCDGSVDPDSAIDALTWYSDSDSDGYGDPEPSSSTLSCTIPAGFVADSSDCDDGDSSINPAAYEVCDGVDNDCDKAIDPDDSVDATTWYEDYDADGYGDPSPLWAVEACTLPSGYTSASVATDCDDYDAAINPGAAEVCDGIDNNCDTVIDPDSSVDALTWYADDDGDGYGAAAVTTVSCTAASGWVADSTDCDDASATVNPAATEVCDAIDNDCDGAVDPDDSADAPTWFTDSDGDGYGDPAVSTVSCVADSGWVSDATDCDDSATAVNPAATEVCDGIDNDCDGSVDPGTSADATTWYEDDDLDGYGDPDLALAVSACTMPSGYIGIDLATDCDDADASINPAATEVCDGADNDCDGLTDPDDSADAATWYADADGDGYGDVEITDVACYGSDAWIADATDCDDTDAAVNPAATEVCDGIDNDCDGALDPTDSDDVVTWFADSDGDGFGDRMVTIVTCEAPDGWVLDDQDCNDGDAAVNPSAIEMCDGIDNDCDGIADGPESDDASTWYPDLDGDGYGLETVEEVCEDVDADCDTGAAGSDSGDADTGGCGEEVCSDVSSAVSDCDAPDGYVADNTDCDDDDADVYPDAPGLDEDCVALEDTGGAEDTGAGAGDDTGDAPSDDTGDAGDDGSDDADADGGADTGDSDKLDIEECGCASATLQGSSPWLVLLAVLGMIRRRQP